MTTPTERKEQARRDVTIALNEYEKEVSTAESTRRALRRHGVTLAIDAYAAACVAEARARIVEWIRGADARIDAQEASGAQELHYMHTIGMRQAAKDLADAIERGEDMEDGR